jgi:hypothetical protein
MFIFLARASAKPHHAPLNVTFFIKARAPSGFARLLGWTEGLFAAIVERNQFIEKVPA